MRTMSSDSTSNGTYNAFFLVHTIICQLVLFKSFYHITIIAIDTLFFVIPIIINLVYLFSNFDGK